MPKSENFDITIALNDAYITSPDIPLDMMEQIYVDLRRIAANRLQNESPSSTVSVTILVHESFLNLSKSTEINWKSRRHFYGAAAETMRRIMIDRARYHNSKSRNGAKDTLPLDDDLVLESTIPAELLELNDALIDLESFDAHLAEIVKLKHFVGLSVKEIADISGSSPRTIDRKWTAAKAWLLAEMEAI
jgi:RNA polymerase sigma factor (TIGR02999 family)